MKKNLAKKIVLGLLTGAVLMSSSVAWAKGFVIGPEVVLQGNGGDGNFASESGIAIGHSSWAKGEYSIAIGNNTAQGTYTEAEKDKSIAIGASAKANGNNSVALGYGSVAVDQDVVSVGSGTGIGQTRRIVNVTAGVLDTDVATVGQVKDKYGEGKTYLANIGSELIKGKNLTEAVVALDEAVNNITTPDLDSYATKTELNNKANASDVYTKTEANATFVKIENNKISNNGDITFDVGTTNKDNIVTISTTGITVGSTSTHIDGNGVYVGAHNFEDAKAAMNDDGEVKGVNATFTGNVTAANLYNKTQIDDSLALKANSADVYKKTETYNQTEVDTKLDSKADKATTLEGYGIIDAYTKTEVDNMLGGSSDAIAGISQRLDKTNAKINKVGAGAAALAALHPLEYDPDDKLTFSAGIGNYAGENAAALGAFYRPNEKFMVSLGGTMGNGENMVNLGLSIGLDKPNGYAKLSKRELIQKVNAMEAKYEAVEAEKEAMKAEMAEMKAMLQAILAKK